MADNNENNPLNDAVEQVETGNDGTEQQQAQQNQQNTIATTIATGADAADAADDANQAMQDDPSGAGASSQGDDTGGAQSAQPVDSEAASSEGTQSGVVDSQMTDSGASADAGSGGAGGAGAGAQSVGGQSSEGSDGGSDAEGQTQQASSAPQAAAASPAEDAGEGDDFDTQTDSETFEVNVLDEDEQANLDQERLDDDFDSETTEQTFEIQVEDVNDEAEVEDVAYTIQEDGSLTFTDAQLLAGASDVDGDDLTVADVSYTGTDGVFTDNGDGTYTFSPNEHFNGEVDLSFSVSDGTTTIEANIDVTVEAVNDLPVAGSTTYSVNEDGIITISDDQLLANSSDVEGDVSVSDVSYSGTDGIFTDNGDGTYSFAPNENFNGNVSLDVVVVDEEGATAETTAGIDVIAVNDAPVSGDLAYSVDEDGSITLTQDQLLSQASDVDGDDLTAANLSAGDNATVTANEDGSFTITPDVDFNGDIDLSFDISDGTDTIVANTDLTVNPVNDAAVVEDVGYTIQEDGSLTFTDEQLLAGTSDIDGDDLSVADVSYSGTEGVFTDNGDGTYTFAPNENFNGEVDLSFSVSDGTTTTEANIDVTVESVNDIPVAGSSTYSVNEDGLITISDDQLLANSSDVEGEVSVSDVSYSGTDGIFTDNGDGTYSFAPNENFNGNVSLDVTVDDEDGATAETTAGIDVIAVNDAPVSGNLAYSVDEDGSITLTQEQLLSQASDVDGDDLTAANLSAGDNATITANEDGSFTITPDADFNGDIDLSFDISDGTDTIVANADLTVNPVNDAAVVEDVGYTIQEDGSLTFTDEQLLAGASDIDGDDLSVADVSYSGTEGVFTDNGDGTYTFAPNENFNGEVDLSFSVSDGTTTTEANIDVTVESVNDIPVAGSTTYSVQEDNSITITDEQLLANSSDVEGDLSVQDVSYSGTDGVFADNGDGTYTFSPNENFSGEVSFDVVVADEDGATAEISAGLTVIEVNDPPIAGPTSYTIDEDSVLTFSESQVLANASDIEGDVSLVGISYDGPHGIFSVNGDGTCSFAPNENFNGEVQLNVTIQDEDGATVDTVINVDVLPINDAPVSGDLAYSVDEDGSVTLSQEQLLSQASDVDGDDLTAANLSAGDNATVTANEDGSFTITPDADFNGDIDLSFDISDGTDTIVANADLTVNPVNDAAVVEDVDYTIQEDGSLTFTDEQLLAGASDIDGDDLSVANVSYSGTEGVFTDNGDGTYTFAPNENFNGDVDLSFSVSDGTTTTEANIDVTVESVNDIPVAGSTTYSVDEDGIITISDVQLLANSSDVEGEVAVDDVSYSGTDGIFTDNGDGTYSFAPNENFNGNVSLDVTVVDEDGATAETTAGIDVIAVNDAPVSGTVAYSVDEDGSITLNQEQLLAQASDVDGDALTASNLSVSEDATVIDNGDGTFTITPDANFNGEIDLNFDISDGTETIVATGGLTVNPVNDAPEVSGIVAQVDEDNSITITQEQLLANASDIDGDDLVASDLQLFGTEAEIVQNEDGSFTITPEENFNGELDFTYTVSDGEENVVTTLDLTVNPVNDAPDAGDEIYIQAEEDQTVGVSMREEPAIRLDQQPEFGIVQANIEDEWVTLEVGQEVSPDTEIRFVPDETAVTDSTSTTQLGTFDDNAKVSDWGDEVDSHTRQFTDGDLTVTTQSTDGPLGAWNGNTHIGHGIGDTDRQGLSGDEQLVVTVEGQDINEISFNLDGLGGWFMEESRHFTEVEIRAFDTDGNLIDSETYHKDDRNSYEHEYTLTTDEPVARFELGTIQGNGTYVVQNMSVSQTLPDDVVFTSIGIDGTEVTETISLNVREGDQEIDLTADLPAVTTTEEGADGFASIVITEEQLLAQASDIDSDDLDIINLALEDDNATLTDNGDGTWTVTPNENFSGDIDLTYQVTDGELVDDNTIHINFAEVNDAPVVSGPVILSTEEDNSITFTDEDLLANASDVEGDELSIYNVSYTGDSGELTDNGDGTYTFVPNENFNGDVDLSFGVSDGEDVTMNQIDLAVIPVNDVPVPGAPLNLDMLNDGTITISTSSLLSGATDVDGDILHVENLVLTNQLDGTLVDNGDNTFSFTPSEGFTGNVSLSFDISDGQATAPSSLNIDVVDSNVGPEVTGPLSATVEEDGTITITQEELLANASDLDGDDLTAVNLSTNDENATIVQNEDGSFTITPSEDFYGDIDFTYDVTDGIATVGTELDLTVTPVNDAPDVPDLSFNVLEDESIIVTAEELLAQATDVEGDDLTVVNVNSDDPNVSVTDNGDGTYTLTPAPDYSGSAGLTFDVSDGTDTVTADIALKVQFVNDAPEAEPVVAEMDEDGVILVTQDMLLENATDRDGDFLVAENLETNDPNATIVNNGDGTFIVTPSQDFNGDIVFSYNVSDGELDTTSELTLTVNPVNDAPDVAPLNVEIQEDNTFVFTEEQLLAQATDVEGDELSITDVSYSGDEGILVDNGDGTYTFTPEEHFSGNLDIGFTVSDGESEVAQTIGVNVEAVADAPDLEVTTGDGDAVTAEAIVVEPGSTTELNIGAALVDQDLSETLTLEVGGLPGGTVIRYDNEGVLDDQSGGITSYETTDITVTFEGEGAGFQNTAGYYTVDEDGNITDVNIGFENASQVGSGGDLIPGQSSITFEVEEGESFNLFVIPNGFNRNDFDSMQDGTFMFRDADGNPATIDSVDPQLVHIDPDGNETVIQSQFGDSVFHGGTNTNLNQDGVEHTRTTLNDDGEIVYGIEDLYGGGDRDYDDFTFTVDVGETNSQILQGEIVIGEDGTAVLPTLVIDQNIEITFPEDYTGSTALEIKATATELSNDDEASTIQVVNFEVDHAPDSDSVSAQVDEDGSITITQEQLLANATDLDGDALTALNLSTEDENVTVVDNGDGTFTITPDADFNGDVNFSFDVSDGDQIVSTNLDLTVNPVNDAAVVEDVGYTIQEDGSLTFTDEQLLAGASDIDGDDLSVANVSYSGTEGVFTDNGNGTYTFAPNENFNGEVDLSFSVSDGTTTTEANVDVTVESVNDIPVAGSTAYSVDEDGIITISDDQLLANSSDVESEVAVDDVSYSGTDGIFTDNGDGTYSFAPNENFNGNVSLDVTVVDEDGATAETTAGIDVIAVNDVPVSGDLAYSVNEDGSITLTQDQLLSQASDVEGDDLTALDVTAANNATVVANDDGSFTITPEADFYGDIDLTFSVTDGTDSTVANIDLTVNPVNDAAAIVEDVAYTMEEDGSLTFTDEQLLANATDVDGDDLSVESVTYNGAEGVFTDNGDGTYTFAPNENFSGEVDLLFEVSDGTEITPANIDITVTEVNDLPVAGSTTYSVDEDNILTFTNEQLLANSSDVEGDVAVSDVSYSGTDGIFTDNGDGTYSFAPNENFNGEVSIDVTVVDEQGATAETTAGVEVIAMNDAPVSGDLAYSVDEDGSITLTQEQLLSQASDVDGDDLTAANLSAGDNATVTANEDGSFTITPDADFNGDIDLSFDISDGTDTIVANADLTVNPVNDAAVVEDVGYTIQEDGSLTFTDEQLLAGASDIDGDDLSVADVSYSGTEGVFTDNGDGTYTFAPNENFNGEVDLSFSVSDGTTTTEADIDVTVESVNDIPVAGSTTYSVDEDGIITISDEQLLANSSDIEGEVAVDDVSYSGTDGIFTDNGDGTYSFAPNENFNGNVSLDVTIVDEDGATAGTTAGIDVIAVNDAPVSGDLAYSVDEDGSITLTQEQLLSQASDVEGDDLTAANLSAGDNATVTANEDGSFTIIPDADFNGDIDLSFDISDGTDTIVANADLTVNPVNDAAVVEDVGYTIQEDGSLTFTDEQLLAGASDIDGDDLSVADVSYTGTDGVFTDNGDGTYTFAPNENFNGDVDLKFSVSDGTTTTEANIDVSVESVNDIPVAGSTSYSVNEDGVITISDDQLLANSSDVEGDVSVSDVSYSGTDGIFTDNGDGTYSFAPNENFNGNVSLDVVVADEDGATADTTAGIEVIAVNDAPVSGDLAYNINEDGSITLTQEQLLSQATDVDGDELTAANLSAGDNANVVDNGDGTFTVTPEANFNGNIDLSFDISDGTETIVANADLSVNPVNDLPTTSDVYANVDEDNTITITQEQLLANAADIEGDALTADSLVADNATIVDNGDGTFSITPDENFNGYIDVAYSISDGDTPIAANLGLTVDPVNDAPIVSADVAITIEEDGSYTITQEELLQFATDIEDDDMTAIIGEQGDDTTVTGTVLDAETSNPVSGAEVTLTDGAGNSYTTVTDDSGNYSVSGSIVNEGTVTIEQEGSITTSFVVPAGEETNGGVTAISEVLDDADMRVVVTWGDEPRDLDNHLWLYDQDSGQELDHIYYQDMSYNQGGGDRVTQDVDDVNGNGPETITIPKYEDMNMHYSVHNYSGRSWDVDGVEDVQVQIFVGDTLIQSFTPDLPDNPQGDHWHVFDIVDGVIVPSQDVSTVTNFELPTSEEAAAADNGIDISEVVAGDTEETGSGEETDGNEPSIGDIAIENAIITDNGDGTYTITPEENFNGEFSISYNVDDGNGGVTPAELDVTVTAVNDLSVIYDHDYTINEDGLLTFTDEQLLAGATDIDGDDLTVESVNYEGADGVFTDNGDGTYTFAPNENFNGNVDLTYDVSDGTDTVSANIDVQVVPINDVPVAGATSYSVDEDGSITISDAQLLANSSDVEGDVEVDSVTYTGTDGVFTDNGDGTYTFSPNENFNGDVSLNVTVVDEDGATADTTAGIDVISVNDLPVAGATTYSVDEDNIITITSDQLLANSSDIEGDVAVEDVSYSGTDGILTDNGDGTFSFAPNENFNGNVSLDVIVVDEDGATADTTASIDVIAVNDAPVSGDLAYSVNEDGSITLSQEQLLAQASDVEGDDLEAANLTAGDNATVTANEDGSFTITPDANFNGDIDLSFDISDGTDTFVANADLTVNPMNDSAVVEDVGYTIQEDGSLTFTDEQLLAGASDIDGDDLSVADVSYSGTEGVFTDNGDGTYTFAPNENFNGEVDLSFSVSDGTTTTEANIDVTVESVNDIPVAGSTTYSVQEDNSITITDEQLLANSSDVEGDVSVQDVSYSGTDGVFADNGDGTYTFSPNENFSGEVSFDVVVADEDGATAETSAGLTVIEVNDPPIAGPTSYTIDEDSVLTFSESQVLANASDIEGDVSLVGISYDGPHGIFTVNGDGTCSFAPNENFNGEVQLNVTIQDEDGATVDTVINVDVLPINDAPVSGDLAYSVDEDGSVTLSQEQLLSQASDVEGDDLTAANLSAGDNATVTANEDGSFTITPEADFNGDIDLSFDISDGTDTIVANADLTVNPVNDAAVVEDVGYTIQEDGSLTFTDEQLLAGASDIDGDDLSVADVSYSGTEGVFTDNGDGTYTFAPNENFNGEVDLSFSVSDGTTTTEANIDVTVESVNDIPVAGSTTYSVDEDGIITISDDQLLANSLDVEGEVAVEDVSYSGTDGIFTDNGDGTYSFAPNENFNGNVSLDVTVVDEDGATADTTAGIDVIAVNDAPVSGDLAYSVDEDGSITLTQEQLLSQASDVDGDDLTAANLSAGDNATVTANEDGSFTITPDADFNGDIDLSFDISDGTDTIMANADLTVNPVNDAAVVEDVGYTIQEDGSLTFTDEQLLAGASDIDGDDLSVADVSYSGTEGVFTDNGDGTYTFAPNENFNGEVDLSFSVSDGTTTTEANIDVTVESVNDIPVAGSTTYSVDEDGVITISDDQLLANSSDVEGEVSVSDVSYSGTDGIFTDNGDGTYSFAPNENFNGDVALDVVVADEDGATVGTTAGIEVIAVNDAPVSGDLAYSVDEDGSITLTQEQLLAQAGDVDGDALTASNLTAGDNATVTDNGDGSFTITPDANFNGDIDLNFDISDGTETIVANADLTVNPVNDAATSDPVDLEGIEDNAIIISQEDLLKHAQDIDGDDLTARDLSIDESFGSLVDNTDGTWTFTPTENFNGEVPFNFNVDDGTELTPVQGNIDIAGVNDEPQAPAIEMQGEEDQIMVIDPEYILAQASDLDGDELTLESISVKSPQNAQLQQQPDGMYHLVTSQDFNGLVELAYEISDGEATAEGSLNVDVIPVNDAPFNDGNAFLTTNEDGAFTFDSSDMLDLFGDIDTENLVISRIIMPDGEDGGDLNDNGDGTWTFTPTGDFAGTSGLQVVASDGEFETALDVPVFVRPVADGAVITTDHDGPLVFSEDSTGHLGLNVDLIDDSEMLSNLVMTGFPVGFEVSDGENTVIITEPGQMISITNWNIDDLQLTPPEDFSGNFFVTVSATTVDYGDEPLPEPEGSEISGDFDTTLGEPIILTEEDLIGMAQNIDANDDDAIQMVHLVDPNQGTMVDNGDGTWTFSPADGFTGEVDFAYVVERDGILHDEQSTIGVHENEGQITDGPQIESIASANVEESEPLNFTDSDMLGTLSSETGEMSIESVTLLEGEGLIESDGQGGYQFTPAEGYTGSAQIGFVASDGENSVESHFNITVDEQAAGTVEPLAQSDDGSIGINGEQVLQNLDVADDASLSELNYTGDEGALVPSGDDQWTFWPDPEFSGDIPLEATVQSGGEEQTLETTMNVETTPEATSTSSTAPETAAPDTETVQETVEATSTDGTDTEDESADVTAAPGTDVNLSIPDEVTSAEGVEQVELSGIPEGASVSGALDNGDGTYTVSGDLSQPVTMSLGDTFEGEASISFQGVDELDTPIEGATATTTIEVDDQYAMQASSQAPTDTSGLQDAGGSGDWTSGDNTDTGVDFTDDSGSFGHDDQSSGGNQHDIDDNNF
ncbi:polymer-forming cytoskeletal family protein [Vibrio mediterranei]|uniref:tandem-95 repeat protein n=1 Tax=Vibrio mediterranei TaxID=689 RepID=UPI000D1830A1|nr:tandem-95 repeat protein [Vibrio mediterranei]PTC04172.1 polymer-forming cytoskeletal family protein [Vibrio mediterranei]